MTTTKAILISILLTAMSAGIAGSTALYIGYRKAQEKLKLDSDSMSRVLHTATDYEGTIHNIAADEEGEFGKRAAKLEEAHPFTKPSDGRLTERQIQQFIAVKRKLLEVDQEMAADMQQETSKELSAGYLLKWNFFTRVDHLRQVEIETLEQQQMTFGEYNWVHLAIYTALITEGFKPEEHREDWSAEVGKNFDRSLSEVESQLSDPSITPERRAELEKLKASMSEGRDALVDSTHALQTTLESVPQENKELVRRYKDELGKVFVSAIELDTIDIMRGLHQ